jgi:hypothetical protein
MINFLTLKEIEDFINTSAQLPKQFTFQEEEFVLSITAPDSLIYTDEDKEFSITVKTNTKTVTIQSLI